MASTLSPNREPGCWLVRLSAAWPPSGHHHSRSPNAVPSATPNRSGAIDCAVALVARNRTARPPRTNDRRSMGPPCGHDLTIASTLAMARWTPNGLCSIILHRALLVASKPQRGWKSTTHRHMWYRANSVSACRFTIGFRLLHGTQNAWGARVLHRKRQQCAKHDAVRSQPRPVCSSSERSRAPNPELQPSRRWNPPDPCSWEMDPVLPSRSPAQEVAWV